MAVATRTGWTFENFSRAIAIGGPTTRARHDDRILWRWSGFIWLRMFNLGVDGAAIDRAAALLALDDPGHGQPQIHAAIIGEQMEKVIHSKREFRKPGQHRWRTGSSPAFQRPTFGSGPLCMDSQAVPPASDENGCTLTRTGIGVDNISHSCGYEVTLHRQ
jgi:hypothetical protein